MIAQQAPHGRVLADRDGRAQLEDAAALVDHEPRLAGALGDLARERLGAHLVVGAAPVQRDDRALVLAQQPGLAQAVGADAVRDAAHAAGPALGLGIDRRGAGAAQQQLGAVVAGVGDRADADHAPRDARPAPADAADEPVGLRQAVDDAAHPLGDGGRLRIAHDRRERAVDVEQHGPGRGVRPQRGEDLVERRGR